ncbi:MAG: cell division protein ZapD [Gammaproteobacteria bacterium]|nr:cell division protein ZapD [Gammaproteobacteria bacterium]
MKDYQIYEQPLNKRLRTMLRLELLFDQLNYFSKAKSVWDNTIAVNVINDILAFTSRTDIKTEVIKELERQQTITENSLSASTGNEKKSIQLIEQLKQLSTELHHHNGVIGNTLQTNIILNAAKQKSILPGSSGNFDSPLYLQWVNQPSELRLHQLSEWNICFKPLNDAIKLTLTVIRNSAEEIDQLAEHGFYQDNLEFSKPYQLIRVAVPNNSNYFPEISAGKHRFSIRFLSSQSYYSTPQQATENVDFILCKCCL